jgi:hypothetical protein
VADRGAERHRTLEQSIPQVFKRHIKQVSGHSFGCFWAALAAAGLAASGLGGCGVGNITSSIGAGGIFGSSKQQEGGWTANVSEASMLQAAKNDGGPVDLTNPEQEGCPPFSSSTTDRYVTVYEKGHNGDSLSVMYRGEVTKTSRECEIQPAEVHLKYGFAGRVLLGPKGQPSVVTLPVTFTVTDKNRNKIKSEAMKLQVEVTADRPVGYYSVVRMLSFQTSPGTPPSAYTLNVTFDQKN